MDIFYPLCWFYLAFNIVQSYFQIVFKFNNFTPIIKIEPMKYLLFSAFLGGTGKYKGIEGEVTTTRNDDGTYVNVLDVKLEN